MGLFNFLFGKQKTPAVDRHASIAAPVTPVPTIKWRAGSFPMEAVGESNYQHSFVALYGERTSIEHDLEDMAVLRLEPTNRHDPNAVKVLIRNRVLGYIPRSEAPRLKEQMEARGLTAVQCAARVRGGWHVDEYDEGDFGVWLGVPTSGAIDFED